MIKHRTIMEKEDFANLAESAKLMGARIYLIQDIMIDYSVPMYELVKKYALVTDYCLSKISRADDGVKKNQINLCDFVAICWPKDGEGDLEKALACAKKNNLKTINAREIAIFQYWLYISEDLNLDIIQLVSTNPWNEKYFFSQIEVVMDPRIYFTTIEHKNTVDFWVVFKLGD